jgi:hypothetical protein
MLKKKKRRGDMISFPEGNSEVQTNDATTVKQMSLFEHGARPGWRRES